MKQKLPPIELFPEDPFSDEQRIRIWCKVMRLNLNEGLDYMANHGYKNKKNKKERLVSRNYNSSIYHLKCRICV